MVRAAQPTEVGELRALWTDAHEALAVRVNRPQGQQAQLPDLQEDVVDRAVELVPGGDREPFGAHLPADRERQLAERDVSLGPAAVQVCPFSPYWVTLMLTSSPARWQVTAYQTSGEMAIPALTKTSPSSPRIRQDGRS